MHEDGGGGGLRRECSLRGHERCAEVSVGSGGGVVGKDTEAAVGRLEAAGVDGGEAAGGSGVATGSGEPADVGRELYRGRARRSRACSGGADTIVGVRTGNKHGCHSGY